MFHSVHGVHGPSTSVTLIYLETKAGKRYSGRASYAMRLVERRREKRGWKNGGGGMKKRRNNESPEVITQNRKVTQKWYSGWLSPLKGYFLLYGTCFALYTDFFDMQGHRLENYIEMLTLSYTYICPRVPCGRSDCVLKALLVTEAILSISESPRSPSTSGLTCPLRVLCTR